MNGTLIGPETEIVRARITPEKAHIKALVAMVTQLAQANQISRTDARNLDRVLEDVLKGVVRFGFEGDRSLPVEVILARRLHSLVVAVEEKGLPFDYDQIEQQDRRLQSYLARHFADEVHYSSLGKDGNRTEIVKHLPLTDIRASMDIAEHDDHVEAPLADPNEPVRIGMLEPSMIHDLVRLVFRCYGYTYANDFMYSAEKIEAMLKAGVLLSGAAYNSKDEIIGHVGLIYPRPGARVAESGEAVVDPRYRGRSIFQQIKSHLLHYVTEHNVVGTYGECVTVHPYSQKGSIDLGGHETGFLLGYSPGTVKFQSIAEDERPRRQSIAMMFTPLGASEAQTVHLPQAYSGLAGELYGNLGYERRLVAEEDAASFVPRGAGAMTVSVRHDHNQALIRIDRVGRKTVEEARFQHHHLKMERLDCIYADIPLRQKGAGVVAAELRRLGFFFGCIIPEFADGDVLRMQYLNNVEVVRGDIKTASAFGERLLAGIFEEMEQGPARLLAA